VAIRPATKTQLNPLFGAPQTAVPVGLHDSLGGEHK
jgi:hypothetical protein